MWGGVWCSCVAVIGDVPLGIVFWMDPGAIVECRTALDLVLPGRGRVQMLRTLCLLLFCLIYPEGRCDSGPTLPLACAGRRCATTVGKVNC